MLNGKNSLSPLHLTDYCILFNNGSTKGGGREVVVIVSWTCIYFVLLGLQDRYYIIFVTQKTLRPLIILDRY